MIKDGEQNSPPFLSSNKKHIGYNLSSSRIGMIELYPKRVQKGASTMKKYLSVISTVLVIASVITGCAGQPNTPKSGAVSDIGVLDDLSAAEGITKNIPKDIPDDSFSKEDYQKLLALQFDDYRHMKISEFQSKVWRMTDTPEYMALLERFFESETLYRQKDSDETAWFLFYILEPLTAEKWQTRTYSGAAISDFHFPEENATLEYTYTLTILNPDKVMVKDYNDIRLGVQDMMWGILKNRSKEELQNEALMLSEVKAYIDESLPYMQTPEVSVSIEYKYFPISAENDSSKSIFYVDTEQRRYPIGTQEDYASLLALKVPNYPDMSLEDFNKSLLDWANENPESMDRISEDVAWEDFQVALTDDELSFVKRTVFLSGMENGKAIQSKYAGETISPYYEDILPDKLAGDGRAAWCSLCYRFSYDISDPKTVTVGERDRRIEGMINAVRTFWNGTDIKTLLKMSERDVVRELERIAAEVSTEHIAITVDKRRVHFEGMDERPYVN